jgi:hypothetical protein
VTPPVAPAAPAVGGNQRLRLFGPPLPRKRQPIRVRSSASLEGLGSLRADGTVTRAGAAALEAAGALVATGQVSSRSGARLAPGSHAPRSAWDGEVRIRTAGSVACSAIVEARAAVALEAETRSSAAGVVAARGAVTFAARGDATCYGAVAATSAALLDSETRALAASGFVRADLDGELAELVREALLLCEA